MKILTPELFCHSGFSFAAVADVNESRELDFNLARRSAVMVNQIAGYMIVGSDTTSGLEDPAILGQQEVDVDPDNDDIWTGALPIDDFEMDSSRIFMQIVGGSFDTAAGAVSTTSISPMIENWSHLPYTERPLSVTNLRHHYRVEGTIAKNGYVLVVIRYHIVELTLDELGYVSASRR